MKENKQLFEESSVLTAVLRLAVPTVISQIILVIYNVADTFFVGLTGSDASLAAVTVCMPAFMFLSAISNLFGVGGSAAISRAVGKKEYSRAAGASAFAFWGCLLCALVYSLGTVVFRGTFVNLLGGSVPEVHRHASGYLLVTVGLGGVFTAMNALLSHLVRAEGRSAHAGFGIALGGVLNIVLDPLFMFVLLPKGREVLGAAVATALSNVIACLYFFAVLRYIRRHGSVLTVKPAGDCFRDGTAREVLTTGAPACLMTLCENISYAVLDHLMAAQGMAFQAGIGVAKKINMMAHCFVRGMSQGVLPLLAYTYSSGNHRRMRRVFLVSAGISVSVSTCIMLVYLVFARSLAGIFILGDTQSLDCGTDFLRILCIGCPFSAFAYAVISFFQAVGCSRKSLVLAVMRKGALDIPLMFILAGRIPVYGIVAATPAADIICCMAAAAMFAIWLYTLNTANGKSGLQKYIYRLIGTGETPHA